MRLIARENRKTGLDLIRSDRSIRLILADELPGSAA
jgi:hypothetical protein